jgi:hypothetical protein
MHCITLNLRISMEAQPKCMELFQVRAVLCCCRIRHELSVVKRYVFRAICTSVLIIIQRVPQLYYS